MYHARPGKGLFNVQYTTERPPVRGSIGENCKIAVFMIYHLDELDKKRYTIGRTRAPRGPNRQDRLEFKPMADEIKNPGAEGAENEYQPDLMTLEDEDGNEITFEVIDALDHKGVHYLAVVEYAEDEDDVDEDAQLVILSVGEDADGEYLDVVDDDETLMEVGALFEKRLSDSFDIG